MAENSMQELQPSTPVNNNHGQNYNNFDDNGDVNKFNKSMTTYQLMAQQLKADLATMLEELKKGKTISYLYIINIVLGRIQDMSQELQGGLLALQDAANKLSTDVSKLVDDIKNFEKSGINDQDNPGITEDAAKQFGQDFTAVFGDLWNMKVMMQKAQDTGFPGSKEWTDNLNIYTDGNTAFAAIFNTCAYWENQDYLGDEIFQGNWSNVATALNDFATAYGYAYNNNKGDVSGTQFDNWLNGDSASGSMGMDKYNTTELTTLINNNNDKINQDSTLINTAFSAGKNVVSSASQEMQTMTSNQATK